jgi:hypothetical protein
VQTRPAPEMGVNAKRLLWKLVSHHSLPEDE